MMKLFQQLDVINSIAWRLANLYKFSFATNSMIHELDLNQNQQLPLRHTREPRHEPLNIRNIPIVSISSIKTKK